MGRENTVKIKEGDQEMTRGQRLWSVLRERRDTEPISLERARLVTASYRETEGLPTVLRRARAFEKIVTEIPIYIDEGQLLVGDYGSRPMAAEWFPEYTVEWVSREVNSGNSPYKLGPEDVSMMKEICTYWKDKSVKETFFHYLGEEDLNKLMEMNEQGSWIFAASMEAQTEKGWNVPNYEKAIRKGFAGILSEVDEELQKTKPLDAASFAKTWLLQSLKIVLKAGIRYGRRYAALSREIAGRREDKRKAELHKMANMCEWIPEKPARTFHEALQAMWFCHVLNFWDTRTVGVSPGRVDQYLYPYYKNDLEENRINREEAIELLECFRVKLGALRNFDVAHVREATSGETQFHNCTLGGQTSDGEDATNELSFLWLEAAERTRTPHPTLSIRWHKNLSPEFALKAAHVCSLGMGYPAWFGDKASIAYLMSKGASLEEARDYAIAGCVLHVIPHKTASTWPTVVSMAKVFEITLYNGIDPAFGKQVGLETGHFEDFDTFEELYSAFKMQVQYFLSQSTSYLNKVRLFRAYKLPDLFISNFFDDCIKKGETVVAGGARYQYGSMYLIPVGVVDVGDSLAAIKKLVFEDQSIGKKELMDALRTNFEGKADIRRQLLAAPKFGNDNDYVDSIVADLYAWLTLTMNNIEGPYGSIYENAPHSLSFHGAAGRKVGALPSGRLAGISLADGAVSPCQSADTGGPTAVIKSAGKIDHVPIFGTLFNMKFHPSVLKSKEDLMKFLGLIRIYFEEYDGKHLQFNIVDKKTLIEAQEKPKDHRNLVVRVAGYSALWVELDRKIQDEIIARTEHSM